MEEKQLPDWWTEEDKKKEKPLPDWWVKETAVIDYMAKQRKKRPQTISSTEGEPSFKELERDPYSADFWLRKDLTEAQKDSAYRAEKGKNILGGILSATDNGGIKEIIRASREKRYSPLSIHPAEMQQIPGTKYVEEKQRKAPNYLEGYLEKAKEGIVSVPENIIEALRTVQRGREGIRKGLRQITGQEEVKNVYTIYNEKGEEITSTSDPNIAELYKHEGYTVKGRYDKVNPLSAGIETATRGFAEQSLGGLKGALSGIPAVMAYTAAMPAVIKAGGDIAERLGYERKKGEEIANKIAPFVFGPEVGAGALISEEGTKLLEESGALDKLSPKDREIAKEIVSNGLFFGTILGVKGAKAKAEKKLGEKLERGLEELPEDLGIGLKTTPVRPGERIPLSKTGEKVLEASENLQGRTPEEIEIIRKKLEKTAPTAGELLYGEKPETSFKKQAEKKGTAGLLESEELKKIQKLADKIVKGSKEFTDEELQLQKNYPELLEQEINKAGGKRDAERIRSDTGLLFEEGTAVEESKRTGGENIQQTPSEKTVERLSGGTGKDVQKAKEILTGKVSTREVIKEAKEKAGENFESEFQKYLKQPNNRARLEIAEDKEFETGLILEDFARRKLAAELLGEKDINADLYEKIRKAEGESGNKPLHGKNVIGAESGRAIKIAMPTGEEKIFVMGEGTHKDPLAMAFRYLADDLIGKGVEKDEAENIAEEYITKAAVNDELDIGDYREGKFVSSWEKSEKKIPETKEAEISQAEKEKGAKKEPWEMTRDEYYNKNERVINAAVRVNDKIFTGRNHREAIRKALESGELKIKDDEFFDKSGKELTVLDELGLFETNKGRIISREEAYKLTQGKVISEDIFSESDHRTLVEQALSEGKYVPEKVLEDYPDLKKELKTEADKEIKKTQAETITAGEEEATQSTTEFAEVKEIPIKEIKVDEGRFQNRAEAYSEETATSIEKNYNPAAFDPIVLWRDPKDKNLYVLAGHSRLEGMKRRGAKTIPAKIFEGTEEEAINYARIESNRQATQEDIIADVRAYKRAKEQGYTKQKLLDLFKKESRIRTLENYSHLDEKGEFLRALNSEASKSYPYLERNAAWVGELRKTFPQLTDAHEQELFDYFYRGKLKHSFIRKDELFDKVEDRVTDITFKPEEKLALDKLESTGARARADTRDIQKKIDILKARNRELTGLSRGAPPEQRSIFQKEILANENEIKKLEGTIREIVDTQTELFGETKEFIKEGELDEEIGSQIIAGGDPEELEKLAEDLESKARAKGRIEEETIREAIDRSGEILYQRYIPYYQTPQTEIESSILRVYNGFNHELPTTEIMPETTLVKSWVRRTQDEEIQRALASFLEDYVESERLELNRDFIKRALKEKPYLKKSYEFLRRKLREAVKKREKDGNILAEYREEDIEPKQEYSKISEALYQKEEWFSKGERTPLQQLNDRRRHLELIIEEALKKGNEELKKKAKKELEEVDKAILKEKEKTAQFDLFADDQENLFQRNKTQKGKAETYNKIIDDKEIGYNNDLKEFGFDVKKDDWEKERRKLINAVQKHYKAVHPRSVINKDTGKEILLGRESEEKPFTHVGRYEQLVVNKNIPDILKNAIYIGEAPNEKNIKGYEKFEYFIKSLKIDGKDFTVKASIGVDKNGRWHYDNSTLEINRSDLLSIVRLNYLSSQQAASKFVIKDKNLENILQEIIKAHEDARRLEQKGLTGIRKVYERMSERERKQFIEEIRKGINSEWLIGKKDLTKEQAKGLTDLIEKAILFDPKKADITTAWEESFHASIVTLARPHLARNLLRENGWDGKGEIWEVSKNPSLKAAHERLANKYIEWRRKQEENPTEPKTRLEKLFQLLRELWAKIAVFLNRLGFSTEAGYFYDLATGKLRKEKVSDADIYKEAANAQTDFGKSLEEFKKGKLTKPAKVTNTPEILVKLGAKQLPITITPDVISKVINKHNITYEQMKDLPIELHDPLMVFESATYPSSFVILTELKSPESNIVAAIHLNKREDEAIVNRIASIYGKGREEAIIDWIKKGLLKYINKKRSQAWISPARLQLPMGLTKLDISKILTEDDFVNNKLRQKISDIQGELYPKDLKYYMDRIARIKNIYELRNWRKKHEAEVEELPAWERDDIIEAWNEQQRVLTGEKGNWVIEASKKRPESKYEGTKKEYMKYLPEASELYDEGYKRYATFSEKIKDRVERISPDETLKLYREIIRRKMREAERGKGEEGTLVEPKVDITDRASIELKDEIERYLISKDIPKETQKRVLQTVEEEILNNPKYRIGKYSKIKRLTYFGEKVRIMTLKYGAAGAELAQRMAKGNAVQGQMLDKYWQLVNRIQDIYEEIEKKEYGKDEIDKIENNIIDALEDRANYKKRLRTEKEEELYKLYRQIYGDKELEEGLYAEIKKAGYPVRSDYFPHLIRDGFIIDEIISDPQDIIKSDVRGLNNFIYADSRYLKPREFDLKDIKRDLLRITKNYIFSVSKALAYKDAVNYYYTDFEKDIPPLLQKQSMQTAVEFMRSNLNPEIPSRYFITKAFREIRSAMYMNFLSFSLKNSIQNYMQKDFARLYMSPEAVKLTNKIFYRLKTATGNLLNAMHEATQETPKFLEMTGEDVNRSRIMKLNEKIRKYEPFQLAEFTNWKYAELGGIIDYAVKRPKYRELIATGTDEIAAINKALEDKKTFDMAVRNGMDLAANTQISPTAAYRPSLFDREIVRLFLMFRRFPITHIEHLSETLGKALSGKLEGAEGLRAQRILRRGLSEDVKPVEALRAVELFRKGIDEMIKEIRNKKRFKDFDINTLEKMRDWLRTQEKILNRTVEKLEPMKNKSQIIYHWSKYYAKMLMITAMVQFLYDISDEFYGRIIGAEKNRKRVSDLLSKKYLSEKEKKELITELTMKAMFDSLPLPFYGLNPANLMVTPLIPRIELFPYGNYSNWNKRGITKTLTSYGLNIMPGLGLVDRITGRAVSNKITDLIAPKKTKPRKPKLKAPGRRGTERKRRTY